MQGSRANRVVRGCMQRFPSIVATAMNPQALARPPSTFPLSCAAAERGRRYVPRVIVAAPPDAATADRIFKQITCMPHPAHTKPLAATLRIAQATCDNARSVKHTCAYCCGRCSLSRMACLGRNGKLPAQQSLLQFCKIGSLPLTLQTVQWVVHITCHVARLTAGHRSPRDLRDLLCLSSS
jgi:hypothetical protein